MIEAAMIWNEPNNKSHWDPALDPTWDLFADTVIRAGAAIRAVNPGVTRVLGGMSPIDAHWTNTMRAKGALDAVDVVAVHGFPIDWNLWPIHAWPDKIAEIEAVVPDKPIWVTEVGVGSFGAEEVQTFGVQRTAELLIGRVPRIFWYSLFDLPMDWGAETRHREAEGSSYYRHFYMGLIRPDGTPKPALDVYAKHAAEMGLMQWFHFEDPRLDEAVREATELPPGRTLAETGRRTLVLADGGSMTCADLSGSFGRTAVEQQVCAGTAAGRFLRVHVTMSRRNNEVADADAFTRAVAETLRGAPPVARPTR